VTRIDDSSNRRRSVQVVSRVWKPIGIAAIILVVVNLLGFDPIGGLRDRLFGADRRPAAAGTTLLTLKRTTGFVAATGEFSVPVFFGTEQDGLVHEILPDAFDGNSGVAIYQGSVDARVELDGLTGDDLAINRTDRTIVITVPPPVLTDPNIDESKSQVLSQNRGLMTRLGEFFDDKPLDGREELDDVAVEELRKAARESGLADIAESNTADFLTALAKRLGYETVEVRFEESSKG